jgi:hypothetical protein
MDASGHVLDSGNLSMHQAQNSPKLSACSKLQDKKRHGE